MLLYVENVDTVFQQAISSGAKAVRAPQDMFYGDRTSSIIDPFRSLLVHPHSREGCLAGGNAERDVSERVITVTEFEIPARTNLQKANGERQRPRRTAE